MSNQTQVDSAQFGPASFVVCALGDLDAQSASLRDRLMPLTAIDGARLVLDVVGAYGLGAAALAVIDDAVASLREHGSQSLVIVTRDPRIRRDLADAGLESTTRIDSTLAEGLVHAAA